MEEAGNILRQYVIGNSDAAKDLRAKLAQVADSDVSVLIGGPTGSGKEYAAMGVHELSGRSGKSISINCGAIPENLVEAELFGYERGAFSGADRRHIGYIERSDRGTLFLDEIGDLPLSVQVKLLRVIETQRFFRVGGKEELKVNFRLVAASHKDLTAEVRMGKFREDLLYRINTILIEVPSLKQRSEDVRDYFEIFLKNYEIRNHQTYQINFTENFWLELIKYDWPGNIRELRNVAERALIFFANKTVSDTDIFSTLIPNASRNKFVDGNQSHGLRKEENFEDFLYLENFNEVENKKQTQAECLSECIDQLFKISEPSGYLDFHLLLHSMEELILGRAIKQTNGNISQAAKFLKLKRSTLSSKILKNSYEKL